MIDWDDIHDVLLDMDGTLLDLHFDNYFWQELVPRRYAEDRGLDVITAKAVLTPVFRRSEGTLHWYCLDHWSNELNIDIATLKRQTAHLITLHPYVLPFLNALRTTGKRCALVTNAHPKSLALKLEHTALDAHLNAVISSHEIGLPKEAPMFWHQLQIRYPYTPQHTLLIDDNLQVLRAARACGIKYLLAVAMPDSRRAPRVTDEFAALRDFRDIMPAKSSPA